MNCEVNGEPTPNNWISYREPGFGGPVELPLYPYSLKYDLIEVLDLIAEDANAFVEDMKHDYEQTGDSYPHYLHDLGYPSIEILIQHEAAFCETIRAFLPSELLRRSFPGFPHEDLRWLINSVDAVRCHNGCVEVIGQAFRKVEEGSPR